MVSSGADWSSHLAVEILQGRLLAVGDASHLFLVKLRVPWLFDEMQNYLGAGRDVVTMHDEHPWAHLTSAGKSSMGMHVWPVATFKDDLPDGSIVAAIP